MIYGELFLAFLIAGLTLQTGSQLSTAAPTAKEVLKAASDSRYVLPADLKGITAKFVILDDQGSHEGTIAWTPESGLRVELTQNGEAGAEYERRVVSLMQHRLPSDFEQGDGRYALAWTGNENGIGKQIALNDSLNSKYRIRDNAIVEVDRTLGDTRLIVNVLEFERLPNGKHLPKTLIVSYFDAKSGALKRSETMMDTYRSQDGVTLPASRRVVIAENGVIQSFEIVLTEFHLVRG